MFARGRVSQNFDEIEVKPHRISAAFREVARRYRALGIGTITGSIIGLIPGVGGQIAGTGGIRPIQEILTRKGEIRHGAFGRSHRRRIGE